MIFGRKKRLRWPVLAAAAAGRDTLHLRTMAAEFDLATRIVEAKQVDFLALRVEPLDILTHGHFADTRHNGQDDGESFLYSVYRYVDARIREVHAAIDADDVFIVMSDHGIRTAMEHSREGLFIATGPGVPLGRAEGQPALRGGSAALGDLFGVETDWPQTGVAPWAGTLPSLHSPVAAEAATLGTPAAPVAR